MTNSTRLCVHSRRQWSYTGWSQSWYEPIRSLFKGLSCLNLSCFFGFHDSVDKSTSYAYRRKDIDNTSNIGLNFYFFTKVCCRFRIRGAQWKSDRIWASSWDGASRTERLSKTQSRLTEAPTTSAAFTAKVRRVTIHQMNKCWKPLSCSFTGLEHTAVWILLVCNTVFVQYFSNGGWWCSFGKEQAAKVHFICTESV